MYMYIEPRLKIIVRAVVFFLVLYKIYMLFTLICFVILRRRPKFNYTLLHLEKLISKTIFHDLYMCLAKVR